MVIRFTNGKLALQSEELQGELGVPEDAIKRLRQMGVSDRAARQIVYEAMMTGSAVLQTVVNF